MDLHEKIRTLPLRAGVYLYKSAEGEVIYVGKAKNLRSRVRSYFVEGRAEDAKTGSLLREAVDVDYIVVDNEKEALALENNLIKQKKPRFNILLRDDKSYPYVKLTLGERFPRVYVTRRLRKDGSEYYGPYFPANLAYRIVDLIHRHFLVPSCKVDLSRFHPRACLQYYIGRCLGPCVQGLTTPDAYEEAVRDVKLFLEGRQTELSRSLRRRMEAAAENQQYELAAKYRDLISTVEQLQGKQRMAAVEGTTWTCSATTGKTRCSPSTCSTCAAARCWTAANFSGKTCRPRWCRKSRPRAGGLHPGGLHRRRRAQSLFPANSSPPCSSRSTSGSSTCRGRFSCQWSSRTARAWKSCFLTTAATGCRSPCRSAARSGR